MKSRVTIGIIAVTLVTSCSAQPTPSLTSAAPTQAPICENVTDECFETAVATAVDRAKDISADVDIDLADGFSGLPPTDTLSDYLIAATVLVDRFWTAAFGDSVPYTHMNYVVLDAGDAPQTSRCTDSGGNPGIATPEGGLGPFYCGIGGDGFGSTFTTGVVYLPAPAIAEIVLEVSQDNHDFAVITIVAHEFGHHVQALLMLQQMVAPASSQVATWSELSADCLAGVFAHYAYFGQAGQLTDSDVEEATSLLWNLGGDLPYDWGGGVDGTREQSVNAFMLGYNEGNTDRCLAEAWPTDF